jgi:ATP-dependent DNA helicase RecQ
LYSGQSAPEKLEVFRGIREHPHYLLYLSPERVQKEAFAPWLKKQKASLFAIDEAHCISKWGHDFREDYGRLALLRNLKPEVPILALTASATPQVLRDIQRQLKLNKPDRHIHGFYRPNLFYQVEWCESDEMKIAFLRRALIQNPKGRILIYCGTRKQCEQLAEVLKPEYQDAAFYHAGMDTQKRSEVQKDFEEGRLRILAATNAFGMGIDHPDIRLVVHYQMPGNIESLYQEMGRAGRDGRPSTCLLLYSKKDKGLHAYFITKSKAEPIHQKARWNALETIIQFSEGGECRHGGILNYFRDSRQITECGHCDSCAPQSDRMITKPELVCVLEEDPIQAKAKNKISFDGDLDEEVMACEELLKQWRKDYAKSRNVPAFMVFSNKTLKDLANKVPRDLAGLEGIYGIGPKKIEEFGEGLLAAINKT